MEKDFKLFAKSLGVSTSTFDDVKKSINDSLTPVILEEREMRVASLDVFSRLLYDRQIFFGHDFTAEACNVVIAELLYLDSIDHRDINIMINSNGGSVLDGLAVIDTMNFINSDVSTTCVGLCASMGGVLLASGTQGKRYILPHGRVMLHQPSSGMSGKLTDLEISLEQTRRCKIDLYNILSERLGKPFEEIEQICKSDNWFIGQEAIDLGICDKLLTKK